MKTQNGGGFRHHHFGPLCYWDCFLLRRLLLGRRQTRRLRSTSFIGDQAEVDGVANSSQASLRAIVTELEDCTLLLHTDVRRPLPTLLGGNLLDSKAKRTTNLPARSRGQTAANGKTRLRINQRIILTSHFDTPFVSNTRDPPGRYYVFRTCFITAL